MKTLHDVKKIEVIPNNALIRQKKGFVAALVPIFAVVGVAAAAIWGYNHFMGDDDSEDAPALTVTTPGGEEKIVMNPELKDAQSCDGISSVNALYNDINAYKIGTDPNNTLSIFEKIGADDFVVKTVADDATSTSVDVLSSYKALAGNNLGTPLSSYFAEEIEFDTVCSDVDIQPRLKPASAPTITVVNDNGVQTNSDSNHETVAASTTYTPCITVKAPTEACSSRYGAIVALEYDATYVSQISSSDLVNTDSAFLEGHATNHSGTGLDMDQFKIMKYSGELCNGKKVEICFDVKMGSSNPGEDQGNVRVHWFPINKDLDADELTVITGIYDEDNNVISQGNTTAIYYTA